MKTDTKGVWLTDKIVTAMPLPERGTVRVYDAADPKGKEGWTSGFGVRIAAGGTKSFVLRYRSRKTRSEHLYTIGSWPTWNVTAARAEARELKRKIEQGGDPQTEKQQDRDAPTVAMLCDRFLEQHLPTIRPNTRKSYRHIIEREVKSALGRKLVAVVDHGDIEEMHQKISRRAPLLANRVTAVASKLFMFAIRAKMRTDNPCRGCPRNPETSRTRYLTGDELARLQQALAGYQDRAVVNALTIMLLTGCRKTEALSATWDQFDLDQRGVWVKPGHSTKQKRKHETPLSDPALSLLKQMRKAAPDDAVHLFPGRNGRAHLSDIQKSWRIICRRAGIVGLRVHDLRHSHASMLVSAGFSLPLIGQLLGHTQVQTTARYSHLYDDVQSAAVNKIGAKLSGLVATKPGKARRFKVVS
jgi:integrase